MPDPKPFDKIFETVPEGTDTSGWVRHIPPEPVQESEQAPDEDTLKLALLELADAFAKGQLTRQQYDAAVQELKGGAE